MIVGIEIDKEFSEQARHLLDYVFLADIETFNWHEVFDQDLFDCVIFGDVLKHLKDPKATIMAALEYLAPNASPIISAPNIRHFSAFFSIFIKGSFPQRARGLFDNTHLRWFTISDTHALVDPYGLIIDSEMFNLRFGDLGGGILNRFLDRLPRKIVHFFPIREFLTYQYSMRAICKNEQNSIVGVT